MPIFHQALNRGGEQHRLSHVPRPIARIELQPVADLAGHRRVDRHGFGPRLQPCQSLQQIGAQRLHLGAVRGKIDLHHATEDVTALQPIQNGGERGRIAGQHRRGGTVADGDRHAVFAADQDAPRVLDGKFHRRHGALPNGALEQPAAMTDNPDGIVEAQGTGDVCGRDLAQTMAHHGLRLDAPGAPQGCQGDLNRKQRRLDDIDFVQSRLAGIGGREFGEQRPISVRPHRLVAAFDDLAENGFLLQQPSPHAKPLAPLPREHKHKLSPARRKLAAGRQAGTRLAPQKSLQALDQLRRRIAGHGETVVVVSEPHAGRVADIRQRRSGLRAGEEVLVGASKRLEGCRTTCRQRQQVCAGFPFCIRQFR